MGQEGQTKIKLGGGRFASVLLRFMFIFCETSLFCALLLFVSFCFVCCSIIDSKQPLSQECVLVFLVFLFFCFKKTCVVVCRC